MDNEIGKYSSIKEFPRFGKIAVDLGFITEEQLKTALNEQVGGNLSNKPHTNLGEIFLKKGWITYEQILAVLDKARETDSNLFAFIKAIKRDVKVLSMIVLLIAFILLFVNLSFISNILDYIPPLSMASLFAIAIGLVGLCLYLSRIIARKSIEELEAYDSKMNGVLVSLQEEVRERKRMAEDMILQSKQDWEETFNSITDIVTIHDKDYNIIKANRAAEAILKLPDLQINKTIKCFNYYHGTDCPPTGCPSCDCYKTGKPASFELFEPHLDKYVEITAIPRLNKENEVTGLIHIVRDLTARKRMEEELLKAQKLESVGVLAGGIAHDFNNKLASILLFSNIAKVKLTSGKDGEAHKMLDEIEKSINSAKHLTQQLLIFSKGGMPIKDTLPLSPFIDDTVRLALSGSNVKSEISIADDLRAVEADEGQINQVISNLVINADQAMPLGGVIKISADNIEIKKGEHPQLNEGKYVVMKVMDSGIGIIEEHLSKIFDPFFTTKHKGSGLGLATAYSIIKKHDGLIEVDSKFRKGTTFSIYLPASDKKPKKDAKEKDKLFTGKGRILLMDDDEMLIKGSSDLLHEIGYKADSAKDGKEAIDKYKEAKESGKPYDAVILDLTIPGGMGGRETIDRLLKINPEVKAIVSSGYTDNLAIARYKDYGFKGMLIKPYNAQKMSEVVHQVITGA